MYDADHQCRLQFEQEAEFCREMDVNLCETLWCKVKDQCITKQRPAAEGTICDRNKWCLMGKCVEIGDRPSAINGEWGQWSNWSQCTRSCGAGIMYSERDCNNPMWVQWVNIEMHASSKTWSIVSYGCWWGMHLWKCPSL